MTEFGQPPKVIANKTENRDPVAAPSVDDSSPTPTSCKRRAAKNSIRNSAAPSSTAACRWPRPGRLLIIAGAGSGKTSTLAHRVAWLIEQGADPRRIMLLTFSRRAAAEMTRRVDLILAAFMQAKGRRLGRRRGRLHGLGRHLSRHRRAAAARICGSDRACARLHHPRSRGFRRSDESGAPRSWLLQNQATLSDQEHLPRRSIRARSTASFRSTRFSARIFRGARCGRTSCGRCLRNMSRSNSDNTCSITTICCSIGRT